MGETSKGQAPLSIVVDTREQTPWEFASFPDVQLTRGTLSTGDYSLVGMEGRVAIERKSLNDLVACLTGRERDRFERELERGKALDFFRVIVESPFDDLARARYFSRLNPESAVGLVTALEVRHGVSFLWAKNGHAAEYHARRFLRQVARDRAKEATQ